MWEDRMALRAMILAVYEVKLTLTLTNLIHIKTNMILNLKILISMPLFTCDLYL